MRINSREGYQQYLKSAHWQNLRALAFQKANGICKCCRAPLSKNFVCHHRTYRRAGRERINHKFWRDDIIAVCPPCHDGKGKAHDRLHEFIRVPHWAQIE
jgi:5-methylcytosine-specific restriction endonuclease McrA